MTSAIAERLGRLSYRKVVWMLAIAETLHNIEEAIWLPGWSQTAGFWHAPVGAFEFRVAVVAVTIEVYAVIYYFSKRGSGLSRYLMGGALVVILFNVFVPHLAATIATGTYAPGVVTGILLNVPVTLYLLKRGLKEGVYSVRTLAIGTAAFAAILVPLLPLSFAVGRILKPSL